MEINFYLKDTKAKDPTPQPAAAMVCSLESHTDGKKLSVQLLYIRLGCGQELAKEMISHLDLAALRKPVVYVLY